MSKSNSVKCAIGGECETPDCNNCDTYKNFTETPDKKLARLEKENAELKKENSELKKEVCKHNIVTMSGDHCDLRKENAELKKKLEKSELDTSKQIFNLKDCVNPRCPLYDANKKICIESIRPFNCVKFLLDNLSSAYYKEQRDNYKEIQSLETELKNLKGEQ